MRFRDWFVWPAQRSSAPSPECVKLPYEGDQLFEVDPGNADSLIGGAIAYDERSVDHDAAAGEETRANVRLEVARELPFLLCVHHALGATVSNGWEVIVALLEYHK